MGIEQTQRIINQLNREIASLERRMADLVKKEADMVKKIGTTQKSITKNTSASMLTTKTRQIVGYQKEQEKVLSGKADINKKMAEKKKRLSEASVKLQREEAAHTKSLAKKQEEVFTMYKKQISELTKQVVDQSATATSSDNIFNPDRTEEFDVFLSHASEDKESFCDEFSNILQEKYELKVWYDSISIEWGDSIRTEIDEGLKKSSFGVVIISRNYIKKYWTNYELEALFQIESNGGKVILPVWHDITKKEIQDFSPTLAGKLAMNTGIMTPEEIAEKLNELFKNSQGK